MSELDLPSEFLLMATHDERGTLRGWHYYGLAGAMLMELALDGRLRLDGKRVRTAGLPPSDPVLARIWSRIQSRPGKKVAWWVQRIAKDHKHLRAHVYGKLVDAQVLREESRRVLLWDRKVFLPLHPEMEDAIRWRLCDAITYPRPERRAVCLASLVVGTQIEGDVFPKPLRRTARRVVKQWAKDDPMGEAVRDVVDAVMAAIIAAVVASTVASTA